ncbi:MAG: DUF2341 domain-containing protein [Acidobacteriota bacterium]|nr:DUF2341 domain-containing protein [Acidobacteriota bacterium]
MAATTLVFASCAKAQTGVSVTNFGAIADAIMRTDGATTAGSPVLTSASGSFASSDVGKYIQVIGAGPGGTSRSDGAMALGSAVLSSPSGTFASTDVGRGIIVIGAGAGGGNLVTTIAKYVSPNNVGLNAAAGSVVASATYYYGAMTLEGAIQSVQNSTTVILSTPAFATITGATYAYGTDNHSAFQTAVDTVGKAGGGTVSVPQPATCPSGAVCGYVIKTTDQMTSHAPGSVKIRYNNVSLIGDAPQTNLFCRGAWATYFNSAKFPGQVGTIRGFCIAIGDDGGPLGIAGEALSNVTVANFHLYGMTNGNTYSYSYSPTDPPLTTTGDGWDETHKAIYLWENSASTNITIDSVIIQDFKGENIYSGGSIMTGIVIKNSTMTNFNGDGISMLAADLQVINNVISNGSNAGIENSTVGAGGAALVHQLYQSNTISNMPREALTIVGVDSTIASGAIQIINNTFDTIAQYDPSGAQSAIYIAAQAGGNNIAPQNVTISGNTCHDCLSFGVLQTSGTTQVSGNTFIVDKFPASNFLSFTFPMTDVTIANNVGYATSGAPPLSSVYNIDPGYVAGNFQWNHVILQNNTWTFPGTPNYTFVTTSGPGWGLVTAKNLTWKGDYCQGCTYSDVNHGVVNVGPDTLIEPYGPVVRIAGNTGPVTVSVDASKEEDGAQIQIVNGGASPVTFASDSNLSLSAPITLPGGVNSSVTFVYSAAIGKFTTNSPITVSVAPPAGGLSAGQTLQLTATVTGTTNQQVTWTLTPAGVGSLSSSGLYTAPSTITTQQVVTATATSTVDATKSSSVNITLNPSIAVAISPSSATLTASQTLQFSASVTGTTNQQVTWSLSGPGNLMPSGLYTAPSSVTTQATATLTATNAADLTKSASVNITLNAPAVSANGYAYKRTITIAHSQVSGTNQSNFPVLFTGVYPYLADVAGGGHVQSPNGYDIIFTSDSGGSQPLSWELESYNPATGAATFWVRVPTLSSTVDTTIYQFYGNPSVTTFQGNPTGTWDSSYQGVWHLPNGTALSAGDSTAHANNGVISNASAAAGEIGGAARFNGSNASVDLGNRTGLHITGPITAEAWINVTAWPANGYPAGLLGMGYNYSSNWTGWMLETSTDNSGTHYLNWFSNNGATHGVVTAVPSLATGTWHHLAGTFDGSTWKMYVDGVANGTSADATAPVNNSDDIVAGGLSTNGYGAIFPFKGLLDELRVSNAARSADWIATEYNNQSSPSTFYAIGSEQITTPPSLAVAISPSVGTLTANQSLQLSASVTGSTNQQVIWSLSGPGTLSTSGLYTAPASVTAQTTAKVTATSAADSTTSASVNITLNPAIAIVISPAIATLTANQPLQFSASVTGITNQQVTWSLSGPGTLLASGLYTAPGSVASPTTATVTATSAADLTKSASISVTLTPTVSTASCGAPQTNAWTGCYYQDASFSNLAFTRIDPYAQFNWASATPGPGVGPGPFSVRWQGSFTGFQSSWYLFTISTSGQVKLYIDNQLVLDSSTSTSQSPSVTWHAMTSGTHLIELDYVHTAGPASAILSFATP